MDKVFKIHPQSKLLGYSKLKIIEINFLIFI